jgi:hypothetical protein
MTHLIKSTTTCGQPLVETPVKTPLPLNLYRTFAAFSKFHLNTSKSPNIKVVQFFEGHNFSFGWHFNMMLKILVKAVMNSEWSRVNPELCRTFQAKPATKTYVNLCESCRWLTPLQLWNLNFLKF